MATEKNLSTVEAVDARIVAANERMAVEIARLQEQHEEALALIARKEALIGRLESFLGEVRREKSDIAAREKRLHQAMPAKSSAKIPNAKVAGAS